MDGFMETYHVRFLHAKTLTAHLYSDRSIFHSFGRHGRLVTLRKGYDPEAQVTSDEFLAHNLVAYHLFPNSVMLWASDHFELWRIEPDLERADHCRVRMSLLVRPDVKHLTARWALNEKI